MTEEAPKVFVWLEEKPAGNWLCLEFHGGYQHNAPWYRGFWRRLRMELGAEDPTASTGWQQGRGGLAGKVWRLNLASDALRAVIEPPQAYAAVVATVNAFNTHPHNVGILMETI